MKSITSKYIIDRRKELSNNITKSHILEAFQMKLPDSAI